MGWAVSQYRFEPKCEFARDVDLLVVAAEDSEAQALVFELQSQGYRPVTLVEHDTQHRLAIARVVLTLGDHPILEAEAFARKLTQIPPAVASKLMRQHTIRCA